MTSMKVLVTRPDAQAKVTIELLRKHGFKVHHQACLDILPVEPQSVDGLQSKQLAMDLDTFDHVIVISTNAAQYLARPSARLLASVACRCAMVGHGGVYTSSINGSWYCGKKASDRATPVKHCWPIYCPKFKPITRC